MILIPEIETVVILTPRTASGSTYRAVLDKYPRAMMLYRHMEADGVPAGYDRWEKIGVVRDPIERLWSLYKFLQNFKGNHDPAYMEAMTTSVKGVDFNQWITENETVFTSPYCSKGSSRFFPKYSLLHALPENRKSQFVYLRPDLGTTIYQFSNIQQFAKRLGIKLKQLNSTDVVPVPHIFSRAQDHMERYFTWDMEQTK